MHLNQSLKAALLELRPSLSESQAVDYARHIMIASMDYDIDPFVAIAVAMKESSLRHSAIGDVGEIGLFQINPKAFPLVDLGVLHDVATNIRMGIQHLAKVRSDCGSPDDVRDWVGHYSGGACRVSMRSPVMRYLARIARFRDATLSSSVRRP